MKVALLGDIHGNRFALTAVLNAVRRDGITRLLVTGDFVGYYFWPSEVLKMLESWDVTAVRGNHEDLLARARRDPEFLLHIDSKYGTGTRVALETLSPAQLDWLEGLPHPLEVEIDGQNILLCHGAPWDVSQYVYPDADEALFHRASESGDDWIVLGHTHYPMEHRARASTIVNPGSVGQPRNRIPGAQWAVLDTQARQVSFMSESYDIQAVVRAARERHPDKPYLYDILQAKK